ncbi:MAG: hypothetical protein J6D08_03900 [Lachnospiraceae bacterium]|nr:hypothetical protein [Lachnospiraceae bacterium]
MWCTREYTGLKEHLEDLITYFEGTCEFCIGNMGIDQYLDEVKNILAQKDKNTDEINMLAYYVYAVILYKIESFDDAFAAWEKAKQYAAAAGNEIFTAKIYSYLAIYYYVKKENNKVKIYFYDAVKIFEKYNLYTELALHYINILWYKRYETDKTEVIEYLNKAYQYVKSSESQKDARVYLHIGYIYKTIFGELERGNAYLNTARELCSRNGNKEMECMTYHTLADSYMLQECYDKSIEIYQNIMDNAKYKDLTANLKCMILTNLVYCYLRVGSLEKAGTALERMESLLPDTQVNIREQFTGTTKWLRACLYILQKEHIPEISALLKEASAVYTNHKAHFSLEEFECRLLGTYGDYYLLKGDIGSALETYLQQERISSSYSKYAQKEAYKNLIKLYELKGDEKLAEVYKRKCN